MTRNAVYRVAPVRLRVKWLLAVTLAAPLKAQPPTSTLGPPANSTSTAGAANVMVLWDVAMQYPYIVAARQSFEETVAAVSRRPVTFFEESLDLERFPSSGQQERLRTLLIQKYQDRPIDVLVATGPHSLEATRRLRGALSRRVGTETIPIVYTLDEPGRPTDIASFPRGPQLTGLVLTSSEMETGRRIKTILPGLRTLAIVASLPEQAAMLTRELQIGLGDAVQYVPIVNPTPGTLLGILDTLPRPAAAFLYRVLRDTDGTGWLPVSYLQKVASRSPVPIFASFPAYLGEGIVGGAMRDPVRHGTLFGQLTAHIINGADIDTIPPQVARIADDAYDWSVMQRYGLSTRTLPSNARVIRKPLYVWEEFPRTTAAVAVLLAALSAVVALLQRNGRSLKRANRERRQLAQHLLTVQDAERQRIARDLHDDVCQEMSAIAVELDVREHSADHAAARTRSPLADRLRALVERTRLVSHGLHAEPFSYAHLPQVLEQEADALYDRHRITCTVRSDGTSMSLPPAMTTGVYRVVMEALQNVVKHASASACTITIGQQRNTLTVTITDNGIGFADTPNSGLGVLSMRERATAMGGRLQLTSTPYQGTTVTLTVPVPSTTPVLA